MPTFRVEKNRDNCANYNSRRQCVSTHYVRVDFSGTGCTWCRGYYVDTVGKYETAIKDYIRNQLKEDISNDQISMKEFVDPFAGEKRSPA